MFFAGERSNYNFPDFRKHGVFKCTANIHGGSARNVINQNYLMVRHFSANGIELFFKRSALRVARTVLSRLASLAIHGELANRLDKTPVSLPTIK